jgi:hypothetical protein
MLMLGEIEAACRSFNLDRDVVEFGDIDGIRAMYSKNEDHIND